MFKKELTNSRMYGSKSRRIRKNIRLRAQRVSPISKSLQYESRDRKQGFYSNTQAYSEHLKIDEQLE